MPVRAALALTMTAVGVILLASFKTPDVPAAPPFGSSIVATGPGTNPGPAAGAAPPPPGPATPSSSGLRDGTYTGQDVPNQFGDVQVRVVVAGGRIGDVVAVQLPSDRRRSAEISREAGPLLHDEALQAQSAQIDLLSGATYTSDSYQRSLQSALDLAHS